MRIPQRMREEILQAGGSDVLERVEEYWDTLTKAGVLAHDPVKKYKAGSTVPVKSYAQLIINRSSAYEGAMKELCRWAYHNSSSYSSIAEAGGLNKAGEAKYALNCNEVAKEKKRGKYVPKKFLPE